MHPIAAAIIEEALAAGLLVYGITSGPYARGMDPLCAVEEASAYTTVEIDATNVWEAACNGGSRTRTQVWVACGTVQTLSTMFSPRTLTLKEARERLGLVRAA